MADQVAIVTGASRGIGFAIAQRFVAEGYQVAITGRNAEALEQAALDQELEMARDPGLALAQHVDVVADREVLARRQRQDAQPGVLRRRPQQDEQFFHCSLI